MLQPQVLVTTVALLAVAFYAYGDEPYRPSSESDVIAQVSRSQPLSALKLESGTTEELAKAAQDAYANYQQTGEPSELVRVQVLSSRLQTLEPEALPTQLLRATLLQYEHQFNPALELLTTVIQKHASLQARIARASLLTVMGRYDEARRDCSSLLLAGDELLTAACAAMVNGMTADPDYILTTFTPFLNSRSYDQASPIVRWAKLIAADLMMRSEKSGRVEELLKDDQSIISLTQRADALAQSEKWPDVALLLENRLHVDSLFLRFMIARRRQNKPLSADSLKSLKERFLALEMSDPKQHARELARYYLDFEERPTVALDYAQRSFSYQRETADYRLLLQAARKAHDKLASETVVGEAKVAKYKDSFFWSYENTSMSAQ